MDVAARGNLMDYEQVPIGAVFVGDQKGTPRLCLKAGSRSSAGETASHCIVFFPAADDYPGPGLVQFDNWFHGNAVFVLDGAALVPEVTADLGQFNGECSPGDLIISTSAEGEGRYHMVLAYEKNEVFVDLSDSMIYVRPPSRRLMLRCRRWKIRRSVSRDPLEVIGEWPAP